MSTATIARMTTYAPKKGRNRGSIGVPMNGRLQYGSTPRRSDPKEVALREERLRKKMLRDSLENIRKAKEDEKKEQLAVEAFYAARRKEEEKQRDYFLNLSPPLEERIERLELKGATNTAAKVKLRRLKRKLADRNRTRSVTDGTEKTFVVERKPKTKK